MHIVICDDVKEEAEATTADCLRDYFCQHNLSLPAITIVSNGQ